MLVSFKAIGRNIRAARTALDITQEEAADRLKISQLHFGRLERGERPISLEMLAQIASVLDVSLSALLNGCMIGEDFSQRPSRGSESLGQSVAAIANGCSSASQRLMLELCRVDVGQNGGCSLPRGSKCECPADSVGAPGYSDYLIFQSHMLGFTPQ